MKKIYLKSLLVLIGVLITSLTTQVWAVNWNLTSSERLYIDCTNWTGDNAKIKLSVYGTNEQFWKDVYPTKLAGDIYYWDVDGDCRGFKVTRMNSSGTTSWNWTGIAWAKDRSSNDIYMITLGACTNDQTPSWGYGPFTMTSGHTFYFNNSVTKWATPYLRVGRTNYCTADDMDLVGGTMYLYSIGTPAWSGYEAITISDKASYQGSGNSIYGKGGGDYLVKGTTNHHKASVSTDMYANATGVSGTDDGVTYYTTSYSTSLPTYTATIGTPSNGTMTVYKYTGSNYASDKSSFTNFSAISNGATGLEPTHILKIVTSPSSYYELTNLSVTNATKIEDIADGVVTYYITGNPSISATFSLINYDITYHLDGGTNDPGNPSTYTYNTATITLNDPTKTGYRFDGWFTNSGKTVSGNTIPNHSSGEKEFWAKWTAESYTITFNINGGDTWASDGTASVSGGGVRTMTMTYDAAVSGTCPTPVKNGYVFKCWSTDPELWQGKYLWQYDGSSFGWYYPAAYADYISTAGKWKKASNVTLYAHYYPVSIMAIDFSPRHVVPEGEVTATVRFNPFLEGSAPTYNPEGDYTMCYTLTTSEGTALKVQPTTWDQDDANLTVTFTAPGSPGDYTLDVKLLAGLEADCEDSPIEDYQGEAPYTFDVEEMNSVAVSFKCGSADVSAPTTARATWSNPATVTAPTIPGLQFVNWTYTGGVSLADGFVNTDNPVQIKAISSGTLTANYSQGSLFFKDTKEWGQVYIYFYNSTGYLYENDKASEGTGSSADWEDTKDGNNKPFISGPHAMTLLEGTTDVYYYDGDIPANTAAYAFTKESLSGQSYFAGPNTSNPCSVVRVAHSLNPDKPMIVPVGNGALWNLNYARYYGHDEAPILTDWGYNLPGAFNEWSDTKSPFKASTLGSLTFTTTAYLDAANATYDWKVFQGSTGYGKAGTPTLTKSSPTSATLDHYDDGNNLRVKSNIAGEYTFTLNYGIGTSTDNTNGASLVNALLSNMTVTVTYPVVAGDYRLIYTGGTTPHPGNVIKKRANGEDIVSMYVASDKADKIKIHACTATSDNSVTWGSASDPTYGTGVYTAFTTLLASEGSGVYDFTVTQDGSGNPTITNVEKYTGRFYVRTNCVNEDKWNYKDSKDAHAMTYSEWSEKKITDTDMRFSHYYVDDLHGTGGSPINIRFTVATDNSEAICDTVFDGDASGKWKDYIHSENLSQTANVRFTYDQNRNKVWRAYTEGPSNPYYMVLRSNGSDVFRANADGTNSGVASDTLRFKDMNNWLYQLDAYANVNTYIKLTAKIAGNTQYLRGNDSDNDFDEDDAEMLIGGSGSGLGAQHMRVTYDFKTDRMTTSWIPSSAVSGTLDIHADIMLLRTHQDGAQSITFSGAGSKLTDVKTAYGVMEFRKSYINDYSLSRYERNLYWISFPFDVNLSDVFGFGTYGEHWIIEYYDGKGRAEKGYWAESEPNWKFVTKEVKDEFVLKANEGYILALALSNMGESSDIWDNSVTAVHLYFPSANEIGDLSNVSSVTVEMDTTGYMCRITRDSRNIKDSYWRCIGVPSYAQSTRTGLPTEEPANWETKVPYVYTWNSTNNSLAITSSSSVDFLAMHSYLVQYPDDVLVWTDVTNKPSSIVRRKVEGREADFYEWNLNLLRNGEHQDHTYVRMTNDENATENFDFGQDVSKEFNSGANIYSFVEGVQVAGNVMPIDLNTTKVVPVGIKTTEVAEYTFSMPEGTNGISVVLVDNETGERTNLSLTDYTVNLEAGQYDGRFSLEIAPIAYVPTDIDLINGENGANSVRKVMVDGMLYIVRDGEIYDAQGKRIK